MATVRFEHIGKIYDGGVEAVIDLNLEVKDHEFIVFVGSSGCGKSTTLRMLAGLEDITSGNLYIDERRVNDVRPKDRDIAMVFQNYALYPHMTVYENMSMGLMLRKVDKEIIREKVEEVAASLQISELLGRKPGELSGGQQQRVALGRAIVRKPKVFLMDEPLSNLDAKLRQEMRAEIIKLHHRLDSTFLYVTHDQTEAMTMGHRIAVMDKGVLRQVDTPQNLYDLPKNLFVAGFIGSPPMNIRTLTAEKREDGVRLFEGQFSVLLSKRVRDAVEWNGKDRMPVFFGIRPEAIEIVDIGSEGTLLRGTVDIVEMVGAVSYAHVQVEGVNTVVRCDSKKCPKEGEQVALAFWEEDLFLFDGESEERIYPL